MSATGPLRVNLGDAQLFQDHPSLGIATLLGCFNQLINGSFHLIGFSRSIHLVAPS